ncbi:MAG: hypothetical protein HUK25_01810 [Treponema sp.]|nr:hypothetical protein [Treponema sp.]
MKRKSTIWFVLFLFPMFLTAENNAFGVPDSSEIRSGLIETWFEASLMTVRENIPEIYSNKAGQEFQVRLEETDSSFNVFVSPHMTMNVDVYTENGKYTKKQDVYPGDAPGSWVLIRNKKDGKPIRIRYYFLSNSEVYIQFTPYNKTSLCDLVIFGNYAVKGIPTGVPFSRFYSASLAEVQRITKSNVPWNYLEYDPTLYHSVHQMAGVIRERLPNIVYHKDAMIDENDNLVEFGSGRPIKLEEGTEKLPLSSSGFIKWVADGLVEPVAGSKLKRLPLLTQTVEYKDIGYQGVLSQEYSLSFALDFVRNISSAVLSVNTGTVYRFNESGVDVTLEPFVAGLSENGIVNPVTFSKDSGYNINVLKSLFYILANSEPGVIYFGAIRQTDNKTPEVKVFNNNVIFMPYFETNGRFNCYVFMNGKEMTLNDFLDLYNNTFVYLTRVRSSDHFYPQ